jgi:hypothetical protein
VPDEIVMRREGNKLVPTNPISEELLAALPTNVDLLVTAHQPRNIKRGLSRRKWPKPLIGYTTRMTPWNGC